VKEPKEHKEHKSKKSKREKEAENAEPPAESDSAQQVSVNSELIYTLEKPSYENLASNSHIKLVRSNSKQNLLSCNLKLNFDNIYRCTK
jgi:hypothetical protein